VEAYLDTRGYAPGEVIDKEDLKEISEEEAASCRRTGLLEGGISTYPCIVYMGPCMY